MLSLLALVLGFLLDLWIGDPHFLYHPVRLIGKLVTVTEKGVRNCFRKTRSGELAAGVVLVLVVTGVSAAVPGLLLYGAGKLHWMFRFVLQTVMCYQLLATKALQEESMKVYRKLKEGDLEGSRAAVAMIVGRDTGRLAESGIVKATVETVAENTSDGVIAPLLFLAIGGGWFGYFYKAINTMDSMVGYRNETYRYFGRCAARLDDVVNYIPARISAGLMMLATIVTGLDTKMAWYIYRRDRRNHASPNSAQTEAVMAGALGIQLAGEAYYFGVRHQKKTIGDATRMVVCEDIKKANRLLYATAIIALILVVLLKLVIGKFFI